MLSLWSLSLSGLASASCGDAWTSIRALEDAVVEGRYPEASEHSRATIEAFGCGPLAPPELVARLLLAEALILRAEGEAEASDDALVAAARLSTGIWVEAYGSELRAHQLELFLQRSNDPERSAEGRLVLKPPLPEGFFGGVDGVPYDTFPLSLIPGLHLVQVGDDPQQMQVARLVELMPRTELVLQTGLPTPLPVDTVSEPVGAVSEPAGEAPSPGDGASPPAEGVPEPANGAPAPAGGVSKPASGSLTGPAPILSPPAPQPDRIVPDPPVALAPRPRATRMGAGIATGAFAGVIYMSTFATKESFYAPPEGHRSATLRNVNNGLVLTSAGLGVTSSVLVLWGLATPP